MDREKLHKLISNLLGNAIASTRDRLLLARIKEHANTLAMLLNGDETPADAPETAPQGEEYQFLLTLARELPANQLPQSWQDYLHRQLGAGRIAPALPQALAGVPCYNYGDEFAGIVCPNPFSYLELRGDGELSACCYLPFSLGNIRHNTLEEIWHSPQAQALRASIKDGSFRFCDRNRCAGMQKIALKRSGAEDPYQIPYELFPRNALDRHGLSFLNQEHPEGRVPRIVSFDDDPTCNLVCPSCRCAPQQLSEQQSQQVYRNDLAILDSIPLGIEELWFSGAGDPIASQIYRKLFAEYDWNRHPNLKIRLDTNGQLLTREHLSGILAGIAPRIYLIAVSVDATRPESYAAIRRGGQLATVLKNLHQLQQFKSGGQKLILRMIVQAGNLAEMGEFVELGKELKADKVVFSAISNWGTFDPAGFDEIAVHTPASSRHPEFLEALSDSRLQDPMVDLGNLTALFNQEMSRRNGSGSRVAELYHPGSLLPRGKRALAIAFYLPQYHPIPENDLWWGKGFTEWTNVTKSKPLFEGHYQPHLPADLGFYDLRVSESREHQAELARSYGIDAFCYWHYWFAGKRLIERPFQEVVASGKPDFPFCLGWANQTWSGIWHGAPDRILIEQSYPGQQDYREHFEALLPALRDPRYLRVEGKPLFVIYAPQNLPDARFFTGYWQELAISAGLPGFHFVAHNVRDPESYGCQACVDNAPFVSMNAPLLPVRPLEGEQSPRVFNYQELVRYLAEYPLAEKEYPLVVPNWDNTPRSGANGFVLQGSTPELFQCMLENAVAKLAQRPATERIVFIKAWNEWAEGNHLEPDRCFGYRYLEVVRDSLWSHIPG